jgi:hydrogenase nickel incorporation protein HypA/HybF
MYELSIAASIAHIVRRRAQGRKVTRVKVAVGDLRQVLPSALSFGFELMTMGTPLHGAELRIRQVPLRGRCRICGAEVEPESWPRACPTCSSFELAISGGEELYVESLELSTREPETREPEAHGPELISGGDAGAERSVIVGLVRGRARA